MVTPMTNPMSATEIAELANAANRLFNVDPANPDIRAVVLALGHMAESINKMTNTISAQDHSLNDLRARLQSVEVHGSGGGAAQHADGGRKNITDWKSFTKSRKFVSESVI